MKTRADLRNSVGRMLGLVPEQADMTGYHAVRIDEEIESQHYALEDAGIAYWDFGDAANDQVIPEHVFGALRDWVAANVAGELADEVRRGEALAKRASSYRMLQAQTASMWSGNPTRSDRF